MKLINLLFLFIVSGNIIAQSDWWSDDKFLETLNSPKTMDVFDDKLSYIPWDDLDSENTTGLNYQPIKTINISFHIFRDANGNGNFTENDKPFLLNALNKLNLKYSSGEPSDPKGLLELPGFDSRIRFSLGESGERIFFYDYEEGYDGKNMRNYIQQKYPGRLNEGFPVFITQGWGTIYIKGFVIHNSGSGYTKPPVVKFSSSEITDIPDITILNGKIAKISVMDPIRYPNWPANSPLPTAYLEGGSGSGAIIEVLWSHADGSAGDLSMDLRRKYGETSDKLANILAHEFGHSLANYIHVFDNSICNTYPFLVNVFGETPYDNCPHEKNWEGYELGIDPWDSPNDKYTNNIMTYGKDLSYISPRQAAIMHWATTYKYIREYVQNVSSEYPLIIKDNSDDLYTYPTKIKHKFYRDLIIDNACLDLYYPFVLPESSNLSILNNASLILHENPYDIYEKYEENGKIMSFGNTGYKGQINIENGCLLELKSKSELIIEESGSINIMSGGELNIETGAECVLNDNASIFFNSNSIFNLSGNLKLSDTKDIIVGAEGILILGDGCEITDLNGGSWNGDIILDHGAKLIVESESILERSYSNIDVNPGAELIFKSNSNVILNLGALINIDLGAKLIYEGGNLIINSGGILTINGDLLIKESANFKHLNAGKINLYGKVIGEIGSSFEIDGNDKSHKALDVNNTVYITGLSNFKLKDCQVQLYPSSQIRVDDYSTNVNIDNILVTRKTTSSTKHKGIYYKSNASVTVKNSDFKYGTYGIYSYGSYTKSAIPIINCNFDYCTYGIYSNYRALNISNSDFEDCTYGWRAYNQYRTSSVNSCDFIDNSYYGIKFRGASSSNLVISQSVMRENISGIYFEASGNVKLSNNVITTNSRAAIEVTSGGNVYLASGYGNNTLKSNKYAVYAHNGNYIYLRDGYNNLISNTYCLYGWFFGMTGTVNANHNEWKSTVGAPVYGNEYKLYSGITDGNGDYGKLYVSDAYPLNGSEVPNEPEEDPFDGPILDKDPYAENDFETAPVNTASFPSTPLNDAIDMTLMSAETKSGNRNKDNKIDLLSEILNYNFDEIDKQDQWMLDYITFLINDFALESIENKEVKIQKIIKVYNHLAKNSSKFSNNKKIRETYYDIAKADLYVINGKYYKAINVLNKALKDSNEELTELLNKRLCEINAEIAFINSEILEDEVEEYVEFCSIDISNKSAEINNEGVKKSNIETVNPNLNIFPNPVLGNSEIISIINENCSGKINLFDITGKLIRTYELNRGENHTFISSSELSKGIYYVILEENNLIKEKEKIIIQ